MKVIIFLALLYPSNAEILQKLDPLIPISALIDEYARSNVYLCCCADVEQRDSFHAG